MQISGVVLRLNGEVEAVVPRIERVAGELGGSASIEFGLAVRKDQLPAVTETLSVSGSKELLVRLEGVHGVERVDLVFVSQLENLEEKSACS